jgi:hypothetical protein
MKFRAVLIAAALVTTVASVARAQIPPYSLAWNTLSSGGGTVTVGAYRVTSSMAQYDAGRLASGSYVLSEGFLYPQGSSPVSAEQLEVVPIAFAARVPQPNPFRTSTVLAFDLPAARVVKVAVYGIDGRKVRALMDDEKAAGRHRVVWDGRDEHGSVVPTGVYFARITAGEFSASHRVVRLD